MHMYECMCMSHTCIYVHTHTHTHTNTHMQTACDRTRKSNPMYVFAAICARHTVYAQPTAHI